jgi:DNA-binding CsgD family transcriptional regulator
VHGAGLIGRETERVWLDAAAAEALEGHGSLALVAGEAGVGKTRLVEEVLTSRQGRFLRGSAGPAGLAYGPIVAALREYLRAAPDGLPSGDPLRPHLALVLPELGDAAQQTDRATVLEAIRWALATIASEGPALVLLDDLQWSDDATLEALGALAAPLAELPLLVVGAYRSDELPRGHGLRRLRAGLRRERRLRELVVEPLDFAGTSALAEQVLGSPPSSRLAKTLHDRTQGVPFFAEELAAALRDSGRLRPADAGLELALDAEVPVPQTIRDAVLLRTTGLSGQARTAAEAAAAAGARFDVEPVATLASEDGLGELLASGLIAEREAGRAAFRHPLVRDAIYEDIPWLRRRELHRALAAELEARGGLAAEVAAHRVAARDTARALDALLRAVAELSAVQAHRDAARLARQALELWPEGERGGERIALLERHALCAELAGELAEAARSQREVVAARRSEGVGRALADAERRLAGICDLQGDRERALAARRVAAEAYAANGLPGEAAAERLIAAAYRQAAADHGEAVELARSAGEEASRAERTDLRARAMGLEGVALAKRGEFELGVETVRAGLSLALEHELTVEAAEVYQRLGTALETAADYGGAREALSTAIGLCEAGGAGPLEHVCLACMAYVLRELGEWERAAGLAGELMQPGVARGTTVVAEGILGTIHSFRGDLRRARPLLQRSIDTAVRLDVVSMQVDSAAALAWVEERHGAVEAATEQCRFLLERWQRSEDHHYAIWGLRWAASFLARNDMPAEARACTEALSSIAAGSGHPDALAALAHALGESALADGDADAAADQISRAVELHTGLDIPFERAQIQLRAGVALAAAGRRQPAIEQLVEAHRTARGLGATPLAADAADELATLGESIEHWLGRRAAAVHEHAGLSPRELEVMRLVACGHTNREIAGQLVLSTRTVDMHVRNILGKLRCRSRTEAAGKAGELGLL